MSYQPIAGKDGGTIIFGTRYNFRTWRWGFKADVIMVEGFEDNGWQFPIDGILGGPITISGFYDCQYNYEYDFYPGAFGTVELIISNFFELSVIGVAMVAEVPIGTDVRSAATADITLEPRGPSWQLSNGFEIGLDTTGAANNSE